MTMSTWAVPRQQWGKYCGPQFHVATEDPCCAVRSPTLVKKIFFSFLFHVSIATFLTPLDYSSSNFSPSGQFLGHLVYFLPP